MLDPQDEEDDDQLTSTGIQQLLDSKELKKTNVAPSISRTTSATAIPKPNVFGYDPHGRSSELVQRNKRAAPHLRSSYALETVSSLSLKKLIIFKLIFFSGSDSDEVIGQKSGYNYF